MSSTRTVRHERRLLELRGVMPLGLTRTGSCVCAALAHAMLLLSMLLAPALVRAQGGQGGDRGGGGGTAVVRGRVFGPDQQPVDGALVTITGVESQIVRTTRTNPKGVYTALFPSDDDEFIVSVRRIGFASATMRATRTGDASLVIADVLLSAVPERLDSVTVTASRPRAPRNGELDIGAGEHDALKGALFSLNPSDLTALAASVPGVLAIGDSNAFSVLDASPDQNNMTLDGSRFGGSTLPRAAIAGARLTTTTFDPARGQFSGGQLAVTTRGGNDNFQGSIGGSIVPVQLSWADPASPIPVPLIETANASVSGPIERGRAYYFGVVEVRRNTTDLFSLLDPRPPLLTQYGLSLDTVFTLAKTLGRLGVPLTAGGVPNQTANNQQSAFLRVDLTPSATTTLSVHADAAWTQLGGAGVSTLGFPSLGSGSRASHIGLQVSGSSYFRSFLDEFHSYLQRSTANTAPYLGLPTGIVQVGTQYADGRQGVSWLRFGGGSTGESDTETRQWETTNEISWLTTDSKHRVKLGQSVEIDGSTSRQVADEFGTFTYQSLADLAANRPSSYTRTLSSRERSSSAVSGALWIGDEWHASPTTQFEYGLRLDATHPGTTPLYNPVVDALFGVRTDHVPNDVGLSPRVGFSWTPGAADMTSPAPAGAQAGLAAVPFSPFGSSVTISGGIGAFRGVVPPSQVAALVDETGLPSTTRYLTCVGAATPIPMWNSLGNVPATCLDGTAPVEFSSSQPNVTVFAPRFKPPLSWRGNLEIGGLRGLGWGLDLSGTYSVGMNQQSGIDLNLRRVPAFTLASEGNRPVYVAPDAIVPGTGVIAPGASRVTQQFGRVMSLVSDLHNVATQFQATITPPQWVLTKIPFNITYVYSYQRAQERGFDGSTAGDPFTRQWTSGQQPTHELQVTTFVHPWWLFLAVRVNISSGLPYTPMVAGDVNGDGAYDDRAFVFDPTKTPDSTLAAQMRSLLASAPATARRCLRAQLNRIAGANSCRGPWQVRTDFDLNINPPQDIGFGDRLQASMTMINASGAILRLLGLPNNALGAVPDPTLLYVTGFDPSTNRYQYRVNQLFGNAQGYGTRTRYFAPFQVQLGLTYKFGGPPRDALARNLGLVPEKHGETLAADDVRDRLRRLTSDPIAFLLDRRDSLHLTDKQVASLDAIRTEFLAGVDSVDAPLVAYVVSHETKMSDDELSKRLAKLFPAMRRLMLDATTRAEQVLTAEQQKRLPSWYRTLSP